MMDETVIDRPAIISGGPHDGTAVTGTWGNQTLIKDGLPADTAYVVARSYYDAVYASDASLTWVFNRTVLLGTRPTVDRDGLPRNELYDGPTVW